MAGGASNSTIASGIFFQGDGQSPVHASHLRSGLGHVYGEMNHGLLNGTANSSAPSFGESSLVTDANSAFSGGPQLQRSSSINNESYMRLPASPMSFSSNNLSGSSLIDGSSIVQQSPHRGGMKRGVSSDSLHPVKQELGTFNAQKKPRLDHRQEDVLQQQVMHQLLQRQESLQLQGLQNPQLNAIIQQQRLAHQRQQQQQILQSLPHMQRASLMSPHIRPSNLQLQAVPSPARQISDSGLCARRLMQYMYHQRRPTDNSIGYWRKFVTEYFAPKAKKRWCLSKYENIGSQAFGAFPQAAMDAWQCDICGSKSGRGFAATYELLPRLSQVKFDSGITDELLFPGMPREYRLASGMMVLEYGKAIQESVYEQLRVVREGQLRITFTADLKILSWEFCVRRHEEFFSRRGIAPQVNQLLQVAHKYQTSVNESGTAGVPLQDLQASCNLFMTAGRQLVRNLDLHSLNELGFSKRLVRSLQISEVVNIMKDLIDFSRNNKIGPIESLKCYPRQAAGGFQGQLQEVEQMLIAQNLPSDHSRLSSQASNNLTDGRSSNNSPRDAATLNSYQYLLRTSSSLSLDLRQTSALSSSNRQQSEPFLTKAAASSGLSTSHQQQPQNVSSPHQNSKSQVSQGNPHLEQHIMQQLVQDMNNHKGGPQPTLAAANPNCNVKAEVATPSRSDSFKSAANNNSSSSSTSVSGKPDLLQNLHLPDLDQDILREFTESGIQW